MHRPVRFADDIEPLVQFIEETDPGRILEATLGKLRDGMSVKKLLTASALAVTRSSDLPAGHHRGPLTPLVGPMRSIAPWRACRASDGDPPILQHVALSNKHINHPGMGLCILADAKRVDNREAWKPRRRRSSRGGSRAYRRGGSRVPVALGNIPHAEALDVLLTVAIPEDTGLDDHYFISHVPARAP